MYTAIINEVLVGNHIQLDKTYAEINSIFMNEKKNIFIRSILNYPFNYVKGWEYNVNDNKFYIYTNIDSYSCDSQSEYPVLEAEEPTPQ